MDAGNHDHRDDPVPGVVRLMTSAPIEMPESSRWGSPVLRIEDRPWMLAGAAVVALGVLLLTRRRDAR